MSFDPGPKPARSRLRLACAWLLVAAYSSPAPALQAAPIAPTPPSELGPPAASPDPSNDWTKQFELGGGISLYYYQPTNGWDPFFVVYSRLRVDSNFGMFGIHFEPRLSSEKMRPYYEGLAWIQEAYTFVGDEQLKLKVGKIYKQLGLFWDNTFYGNIHVYEGLKSDPNAGFSLEAKVGEQVGFEAFAQVFVTDGHTNSSLIGRDTISIPGARRRDILLGRVKPFVELARGARLELGLSAERFTADLPSGNRDVTRLAADTKLTLGPFGMWGEVLHQSGTSVTDFPYPADARALPAAASRTSADNTYLLAGAEYTFKACTLRYNLSIARYSDVEVEEVLHLPGLGVSFHERYSFLFEYASWRRHAPEGASDVDASMNFTWMGRF